MSFFSLVLWAAASGSFEFVFLFHVSVCISDLLCRRLKSERRRDCDYVIIVFSKACFLGMGVFECDFYDILRFFITLFLCFLYSVFLLI